MENIDRTQFVVLTGHLDDQPLPDLIRMLRVQRKSGRLQVEYTDAPGSFFFEEGQLVDAQLGSLSGLEALYAAIELPRGASFNFNPLVRPPERSIDRLQQKFIADLVEAPRRENLTEIKMAGGAGSAPHAFPASTQAPPLQLAPVPAELIAPLEERLTKVEEAIDRTSRRFSRERLIYAVVISFLVGLTMVTALQALLNLRYKSLVPATQLAAPSVQNFDATGGAPATTAAANLEAARSTSSSVAVNAPLQKEAESNAPASSEREGVVANSQAAAGAAKKARAVTTTTKQQTQSSKTAQTASREVRTLSGGSSGEGYLIHVLVEVKNGQVTDARVLNPRPGARSLDAQAVRMAKQRRYPNTFTGSEAVMIRARP